MRAGTYGDDRKGCQGGEAASQDGVSFVVELVPRVVPRNYT